MAKKNVVRISVIIAILLLVFLPPFARWQELRYKNKNLENQINTMKREIKLLERERYRLQTDITYVEKKAREKMNVVRKGEIVLKEVPARK